MAGRLSVPQNDAPLNPAGRFSQSWSDFFQKLADLTAADRGTDDVNSLKGQTADLKARLDYLAGSVVRWDIGHVLLTAVAMDQNWLPCDGTFRQISDYPTLAALLADASGPGATNEGRFFLPLLGDVVGVSGSTELRYWIRAV